MEMSNETDYIKLSLNSLNVTFLRDSKHVLVHSMPLLSVTAHRDLSLLHHTITSFDVTVSRDT